MAISAGDWGGWSAWRMTSAVFSSDTNFCEANMPGGRILIDPGLDGEAIDAKMVEYGLRPHHVLGAPHYRTQHLSRS